MAGTKVSSHSPRSRKQVKISYVDSGEEDPQGVDSKHPRSSPRSSRRDRVNPEVPKSSREMDGDGRLRSKRLAVETGGYQSEDRRSYQNKTPNGVRGSGDLRSPGVKNTPIANTASKVSSGQAIPDFITQTDANGNAITPRSEEAINGARKSHPTGRKPKLHVDSSGRLSEDDSDNDSDKGDVYNPDDPCEAFLESLRMMCCCFIEDGKPQRSLTGQLTQDSDDRPKLLGDLHPDDNGKKCLVLDLDETLVHSSFRAVPNADFVIPVQIEDVVHFVYVAKRPGVDEFLVEMAKHYEIVVYTASLNKYADPLLDLLDPKRVIRTRLFRESCVYYEGNYVKDLSLLDRDLKDTIIIDNSPSSYSFHPENAIDCSSFIDNPRDRELDQIGAFLAGVKDINDVRGVAPQWKVWPSIDTSGQYLYKAPLR